MIRLYLAAICLLVLVSSGVFAEPPATAVVPMWPSPSTPVFGQASSNIICVYVFGEVKRPGTYHLPRGYKLGYAVEAAQDVTPYAWWSPAYSAVLRPSRGGGKPEVIPFKKGREQNIEMALEDGDQIYFSHEVC